MHALNLKKLLYNTSLSYISFLNDLHVLEIAMHAMHYYIL